jgi:DNA invertase Pin-like site-specific DNA recombinase
MIVGYARVSTDGQTLDAQVAALKAAGAGKVYQEKISGARSDRPALAKAIAALAEGDTLLVTRLDRLARSTRDLLNTLATISDKGACFKSLADTWCDTSTPHGKLMTTILGGLAEFERSLIKSRCDAGIARARAAGIRFGRRPKLSPYQRQEAIARREAGEPQSLIAATFNVDQSTISRLQAVR